MQDALPLGTTLEWRGKLWTVVSKRLKHKHIRLEAQDGDEHFLEPEALRRAVVDGEIKQLIRDKDGKMAPVQLDWRSKERPSETTRREMREHILSEIDKCRSAGESASSIRARVAEICEERKWKTPCERTLRNWQSNAKGHPSNLSPRWAACGNRRQGPDGPLLQSMSEAVEVTLAQADRFTLSLVWKLVEARYRQLCKETGAQERQHSIKKLRNFMKGIAWSDLCRAQLDGRTAAALTRTAVNTNTAQIYWEKVECDAAQLHIWVCDDEGRPLGCPTMYAAIDVATGYPVALCISILKPSAVGFVECMRYMYFPKPEDFDNRYQIKKRLEVYGKPYSMQIDNGSEFIGKEATTIAGVFLGDAARCKPYAAWEKPHIERFNGAIQAFVHSLSGSTYSATTKKARDPIKAGDKLPTMDELRGEVYRYVYDAYVFEPNELRGFRHGGAVAPYDLWKIMEETYIAPVPVSQEEFDATLFYKTANGTLTLQGIEFRGLTFHSRELGNLYQRIGKKRVKFLFSEVNANQIMVFDDTSSATISAAAKQLGVPVDWKTVEKMKQDLTADGKELSQRNADYYISKLESLKDEFHKTRDRAKVARTQASVEHASAQARRTMPVPKAPVSNADDPNQSADAWGSGVAGRMRGEQ